MALALPNSVLYPHKHLQFPYSIRPYPFHPSGPDNFLPQFSARRPIPATANETLSSIVSDVEKQESDVENKSKDKRVLADCWREFLGENKWAGLLDPIDPLLRSELIRYGCKAQACYDAFDFDPSSKYCGSSRFPPTEFFERLGMADAGYCISRFLYATSNINLPNFFKHSRWPKVWSKNANWIGYIAVSNDEMTKKLGRRDVCIAWRGTVTRLEWIADLMDFLRPISTDKIPCPDSTVKVESGFLDLYTNKEESCQYCVFSAKEQILAEISKLVNTTYANEEVSITITGHSLGGALAVLSAFDIVETGVNVRNDKKSVPVCVFTFGGPRVGNRRFKERLELLGVKVLRVVNVHDVVPKSPGFLINENSPPIILKLADNFPWSYSHVGVELALDHSNSPFLRPDGDLACAHNLEAHLHMLDGYHGKGEKFVLTSKRDHALVNKSSDFLKDEYEIPANWRQDFNKGMINKDGRWMQENRLVLNNQSIKDIRYYLSQIGMSTNKL